MTLLVSVVVPTYRRPQLLDRCLRALLAQNFPPHAYEIIVVDDGPEDPVPASFFPNGHNACEPVLPSWPRH